MRTLQKRGTENKLDIKGNQKNLCLLKTEKIKNKSKVKKERKNVYWAVMKVPR